MYTSPLLDHARTRSGHPFFSAGLSRVCANATLCSAPATFQARVTLDSARGTLRARATLLSRSRPCGRERHAPWCGAQRAALGAASGDAERSTQEQVSRDPSGARPSSGCRRSCSRPWIRPSRTAPPSTRSPPAFTPEGGGTCSRSAVGRYAKDMRDLIRHQQESDRQIEAWVQRARRAAGGPGGAHSDREPALDGPHHHGPPQQAGGARVHGGACPALPRAEPHRERRQAPARAGAGARGGEGGGGAAPGREPRGPLARDRRHHPGGGRGQAAPAHASAHRDLGAGRPVEPAGHPSCPSPSRTIPAKSGPRSRRGCIAPAPNRSCPSGRRGRALHDSARVPRDDSAREWTRDLPEAPHRATQLAYPVGRRERASQIGTESDGFDRARRDAA